MVAATVAALGGLHVAVNNAGVNHNSAAEETPVGEWDATFALNARGVFLCCQVARSGRDTPRDAPEMHPRCAACSCAARWRDTPLDAPEMHPRCARDARRVPVLPGGCASRRILCTSRRILPTTLFMSHHLCCCARSMRGVTCSRTESRRILCKSRRILPTTLVVVLAA